MLETFFHPEQDDDDVNECDWHKSSLRHGASPAHVLNETMTRKLKKKNASVVLGAVLVKGK